MECVLSYENKVIEYFIKISELSRNLTRNDNFYFSNNENMYEWYIYQSQKIEYETSQNKELSKQRLENIMLFAKLDNYLYELNNSRRLKQYKNYVLEYISKINEINRDITKDDDFVFFDGIYMYNWYKDEYDKLIIDYYSNDISKYRFEEMSLFLKINDILNNIDDKRLIITNIDKFNRITREIQKIK